MAVQKRSLFVPDVGKGIQGLTSSMFTLNAPEYPPSPMKDALLDSFPIPKSLNRTLFIRETPGSQVIYLRSLLFPDLLIYILRLVPLLSLNP